MMGPRAMRRLLPGLLAGTVVASGLLAGDPSAREIIERVQNKFRAAAGVEIRFTQHFEWAIAGEKESFAGTLIIGKNNRFRIETDEQIVVSDGKTVWTADRLNQQVLVDRLRPEESEYLPGQFMFNFLDRFRLREMTWEPQRGKKSRLAHLVFDSKESDRFIQTIEVWVNPESSEVARLAYRDANENWTVYEVNRVNYLPEVPAKVFRLDVPDGWEVIDLRSQ